MFSFFAVTLHMIYIRVNCTPNILNEYETILFITTTHEENRFMGAYRGGTDQLRQQIKSDGRSQQ